ncbi:MAG: hypothetical protein ACRDP8_20125 [Actinopolymorphaceae bacterium]
MCSVVRAAWWSLPALRKTWSQLGSGLPLGGGDRPHRRWWVLTWGKADSLRVVATSDGSDIGRVPAPRPLTAAQARLRVLQPKAARQTGCGLIIDRDLNAAINLARLGQTTRWVHRVPPTVGRWRWVGGRTWSHP